MSLLAETGCASAWAWGCAIPRSPTVGRCNSAPGRQRQPRRAKSRPAVVVPVSAPLVRLYSEYMHTEYGEVDSDYIFVDLFGGDRGRP